jgi:hypothetical protein
MKVKVLFFAKIVLHNGVSNIFFALKDNELPVVSIVKQTIDGFIKMYPMIRHGEFDSHVGKNFSIRYLIEWQTSSKDSLPNEIKIFDESVSLKWLLFPQAVRVLRDGKEKNFLQLAVQYISNGGIDESVIAADFDEAFLKTLQRKLDE